MNIDILYTEDCPNAQAAIDLVNTVVADLGVDAEIQEVLVRGPEEARRLRFLGSPTILVDFTDIEPGARGRSDFSIAGRSYGGELTRGTDEEVSTDFTPETAAPPPGDPKIINTPICPGCLSSLVRLGMHKSTAVAHNYHGREYYFCSRGCVDVFEQDGERYLQELKDLIVCPVCLGERYIRSSRLAVIQGSIYYTCRAPRCQEYFAEAPDFYLKRLAGAIKNAGVKDHDGISLG
jgi:YHS domain-containing protein